MGGSYDQLAAHLKDVHQLGIIYWILMWDQQVNMPRGGAEARGVQMGLVSRLRHEMLTSDKTARLLEDAEREMDGAPFDSDEASLLRVARREHDGSLKLPAEFVARLAEHKTAAHEAWAKARAENNFKLYQPALEKMFALKIEECQLRGYDEHPYDALLSVVEPGMTTAQVKALFDGHKPALVDLIAAISERADRVSDALVHQPFDVAKQREFALFIASAIGFDFNRGTLDVSLHPFEIQFSRDDVRLTTRFYEDFLNPSLFGTLHEAGHGVHAQGFGVNLEGTYLSDLDLGSGALAESQSRTWENLVGRSRGFWTWAFPKLKETFPAQFAHADAESVHRAVNKVSRSFIRVEADEATYNLHIMLRFELESDVLAGKLKVADLPDAWKARFKEMLGVTPPSDTVGVLQDIHWSQGGMGHFQSYALGNLLAAQFYAKAVADHPTIPDDIAQGNFTTLLRWATDNLYRHGRKFTADELVRRVTGEPIQYRDYVRYLQAKFADIYGL
jgi:carboxypeptidase Taq